MPNKPSFKRPYKRFKKGTPVKAEQRAAMKQPRPSFSKGYK